MFLQEGDIFDNEKTNYRRKIFLLVEIYEKMVENISEKNNGEKEKFIDGNKVSVVESGAQAQS